MKVGTVRVLPPASESTLYLYQYNELYAPIETLIASIHSFGKRKVAKIQAHEI